LAYAGSSIDSGMLCARLKTSWGAGFPACLPGGQVRKPALLAALHQYEREPRPLPHARDAVVRADVRGQRAVVVDAEAAVAELVDRAAHEREVVRLAGVELGDHVAFEPVHVADARRAHPIRQRIVDARE